MEHAMLNVFTEDATPFRTHVQVNDYTFITTYYIEYNGVLSGTQTHRTVIHNPVRLDRFKKQLIKLSPINNQDHESQSTINE